MSADVADAQERASAARPGSLVAALGGDGFMAPVAQGAAAAGADFLPLPGGRGNDICAQIGLPSHPVRAAELLPTLVRRDMDLGWIETADGRSTPFLGTVNIGFDSHANARANTYRRNFGSLTYIAAGVQTLFAYRGAEFTVTVDGRAWTRPGWFVTLSAAGSCGGGLVVGPDALADDGLLDLTFQREGSPWFVVETFARALVRATRGASHAEFDRGAEIRVSSPESLIAYADGDAAGPLPARIVARQGTVRTLVPEGSRLFRWPAPQSGV
jgi:diacylglycerol kinase family enzyme